MSFLYLVFCVLRLGRVGNVGRAETAGCNAITLAILLLHGYRRAPLGGLLHTKRYNKQHTALW